MKPRLRSPSPAPDLGFTLIEVLVSLAILAISTVALGSAYVNLLMTHEALRKNDGAENDLRWARVALLTEPDRATAERGGDVILPDSRTAHWRATITPAAVSDLFDVSLEVEMPPSASGGELLRTTTTLRLLRPTWSTKAERDERVKAARIRLEKAREAMK
jgi:prepilin-type N-terminal cleavage/methylation domain-containing protein